MKLCKFSSLGSVIKGGIAPILQINFIIYILWISKLDSSFGFPINSPNQDTQNIIKVDQLGNLSKEDIKKVLCEQFMKFEILLFETHILGYCAITALISIFGFKPAWHEDEESYELYTNIWKTKNTQDYLHFMKDEMQTLNLFIFGIILNCFLLA